MSDKKIIGISLLVFLSGLFLAGCSSSSGNKAPIAHDQSITLNENTIKEIVLSGVDPDNDVITYKITSAPNHGVYQGNKYIPQRNFYGQDSFTFIVNDGKSDSAPATISIIVNNVDEPASNVKPVAVSLDVTMAGNTNKEILMVGIDENGDTLSFEVISAPSHGTYVNSIYTPDANYFGTDSFTYTANDGQLDSVAAIVSIAITESGSQAANVAPVATAQQITMAEDSSKEIILSGTDSNGDALTYQVVTAPTHGTYTGTVYTPNANYFGADSFTFKANDGQLDSASAVVAITITDVAEPTTNIAPTATAQQITMAEDTSKEIILSGTDSNGDALTYQVVTSPAHGTFTGSTYTPSANYFGTDSFTFKANDGQIDSALATVTITITDVEEPVTNAVPVATTQQITMLEDTSQEITLTGTDGDGDTLTYQVVTPPEHGTYTGTTYTPEENYHGTDSFTFTADDGNGGVSSPATIGITVTNVGEKPIALAQSVQVQKNGSIDIELTGTDEDSDNDLLTFSIVDAPTHGSFDGTSYTPTADYVGTDSFTFTASDGELSSATTATVSITVVNNTSPVANEQSLVKLQRNLNKRIVLTGSDAENNDLAFVIVSQPLHGKLTGVDGDLIYHPEKNFSGTDSFTFKVNDGAEDSEIVTINLKVFDLQVLIKSTDSNLDGEIDKTITYTTALRPYSTTIILKKATYYNLATPSVAPRVVTTEVYNTDFPKLLLSRINFNTAGQRTSTYVYTYNVNQQLIKWKQDPNGDGTFTYFVQYGYDANGNRDSITYDNNDDASDGITSYNTTTFDSDGRELINTRYDSNNAITRIATTTYDGLIGLTEYDEGGDGSIEETRKATYDIHGNLLINEWDSLVDDEDNSIVHRAYNDDGNIISSYREGYMPTTYSYGPSGVSFALDVEVLLIRTTSSSVESYTYGFVALP